MATYSSPGHKFENARTWRQEIIELKKVWDLIQRNALGWELGGRDVAGGWARTTSGVNVKESRLGGFSYKPSCVSENQQETRYRYCGLDV